VNRPLPPFRIAPSILSADFSRLGEEVASIERGGADQVHVDVMDGHFVDNLTMGPLVVEALRRVTELPLDVHLMIEQPHRYLGPFVDAGADHVTFHVEAQSDPGECIEYLRSRGVGVGVAINPDTPAAAVLPLLPLVDMVLVMTVHPGFGGQSFLAETLEKIPLLRQAERGARERERPLDVQVDGGISLSNLDAAARAGANVFVAGSAIYRAADPAAAVRSFRDCLERITV
jgi:ribulose-phosphate 3-epimerase